ncbi:hypothetical protein CHUAL_000589 [Chamberlinius hualienensis]
MADPRLKPLKIKSGVVKRLVKEYAMYGKEADKQREKIEKMKLDDKDDYNIRKQEEVLQESLMMIPDCKKRLAAAHQVLKQFVDAEQDLIENEDYQTALNILTDAEKTLMAP